MKYSGFVSQPLVQDAQEGFDGAEGAAERPDPVQWAYAQIVPTHLPVTHKLMFVVLAAHADAQGIGVVDLPRFGLACSCSPQKAERAVRTLAERRFIDLARGSEGWLFCLRAMTTGGEARS